jgi:hypothetical protein
MILLQRQAMDTLDDLKQALQKAIVIELSTLPPYLYAAFTIRDGTNGAARLRIGSIVREEMIHMGLACNVLNAIGGTPVLTNTSELPTYPGPLPYSIGADGDEPFLISLLRFSPEAMTQAMRIEEPEKPIHFPTAAAGFEPTYHTIGQFYGALDDALRQLGTDAWSATPRNQLTDHPFFAGELFPVTGYKTASQAIQRIVSEGEGNTESPLDFEGELAHYYRFEEIRRDQVLQKDSSVPEEFRWGDRLGVDWSAVVPAIANPGEHDFSCEPPAAQAAQNECDRAFTDMLSELERAVHGEPGRLGNAVRAMFDLRLAARTALATPLADNHEFAGPAFRFRTDLT